MGKFPKTLTAAEAGSKSLFKLADALLEETEVYGRGEAGLEQAQSELLKQGHVFPLDRLGHMRSTAKWVSANVGLKSNIGWQPVSYTVHQEAARYSRSDKLPVLFDWHVFTGLVQEKADNGFITDHEGERLPPTKSGREISGTRLTQNELRLYVEKEPNIPRTDLDVIASEDRLAEEVQNSSDETVDKIESVTHREQTKRNPRVFQPKTPQPPDYNKLTQDAVYNLFVVMIAEKGGKWTPDDMSQAHLVYLHRRLSDRQTPPESIDSLIAEIEDHLQTAAKEA